MIIERPYKIRSYFGIWYDADRERVIRHAKTLIPYMQFPLQEAINIFNTVWCKGYEVTEEEYKEGGIEI